MLHVDKTGFSVLGRPLNVENYISSIRFKGLLYPLCVAAGICYGSMFSLVLALCGDLFGAEHIGTNYGLLDLGTFYAKSNVQLNAL